MTTDYATLAQLKTRLRITGTSDDAELGLKLTSASRRIDRDTGRRFYTDATVSPRTYFITSNTKLIVDDISTATGLIVEAGSGTSWSTIPAAQYVLGPPSSLAEGKAAYYISRMNSCWGIGAYPMARVTGQWGWPAVPSEITEACLILAARLFRRKDSPEGVAGFSDLGVVRVGRYDPDYESLIGPYVRQEI